MNKSVKGLATAIQEQRLLIAQQAAESLPAFERIIAELPALRDRLGLGAFLGAIIIDHKPRVFYRFLIAENSPVAALGPQVVLKVYGDRPRGEGPLQQLWRGRNLDVPRLVCGESDGCSWLVIEHLEMRPPSKHPHDQLSLVDQLARIGTVMHCPNYELTPLLRPLDEVMVPRWEAAAAALRRSEHAIPSSWLSKAITAYTAGSPVPLHGDLAPANMGRLRDGRLTVFDASALYGTQSFDAARWSARVGTNKIRPETLFKRWMTIEKLPPEPAPEALLAAECVLEAGSREIVRSRLTQKNLQTHPQAAHGVRELLAIASQHWS